MMKHKWMFALPAAYLTAIMPRVINRPKRPDPVFYAHRGLHCNTTDAPENSMSAFQKAVEAGYGIELDVQLTKDQQVVVIHDFNLKRVAGVNKSVDALTYRELCQYTLFDSQEKVPLLADVLKLVDGRVPLIVELKVKNTFSNICEKADEILSAYQGAYCVESFHPAALIWYRKNRPDVCRGQLSMNFQKMEQKYHPVYWIMRHLLTNFLTAPDFIAYDCRTPDELSLKLCRRLFRIPVVGWTIRSQSQLDRVRDDFDYYIFEDFTPSLEDSPEREA